MKGKGRDGEGVEYFLKTLLSDKSLYYGILSLRNEEEKFLDVLTGNSG